MHKRILSFFFALILTSFALCSFPHSAYALDNWLIGWSYRKSHVINSATGAGTNYQIPIVTYYGSGSDSDANVYLNSHSRTDFGDVRFTASDGTTELKYWMQDVTASNHADFWVKIAGNLTTSAQTIYVYYGASSQTTTSDGPNTFRFFDNFPGTSLDTTTKWTVVQGTAAVASSLLTFSTNADKDRIITKASFSDGVKICSRLKMTGTGQYTSAPIVWHSDTSVLWGTGNNYYTRINANYYSTQAMTTVKTVNTVQTTVIIGAGSADSTNYHNYMITKTASLIRQWMDGTQISIDSTDNTFTSGYVGLAQMGAIGGSWDWIFIASYVNPEPAHSTWGSQEIPIAIVALTQSVTTGFSFAVKQHFFPSFALGITNGFSGILVRSIFHSILSQEVSSNFNFSVHNNFYAGLSASLSPILEAAINGTYHVAAAFGTTFSWVVTVITFPTHWIVDLTQGISTTWASSVKMIEFATTNELYGMIGLVLMFGALAILAVLFLLYRRH